jgi:hypothetical protein
MEWNGTQWCPFHHIPLLTYILVPLQFGWNGMESLIILFVQWLNYKYNLIFIIFLLLPDLQLCFFLRFFNVIEHTLIRSKLNTRNTCNFQQKKQNWTLTLIRIYGFHYHTKKKKKVQFREIFIFLVLLIEKVSNLYQK